MKASLFLAKSSLLLFVLGQSISSYAYHYGMAGCGVGSLVFQDQPGMIQIVAATLNNIVSPQTSAITSGTSGCYEDADTMANLFFKTNKQSILQEIALGQGEALDGLSKIYGCTEPGSLNKALRAEYSEIIGSQSSSADELRYRVETIIRKSQLLSSTCKDFA